MNVLTKTKKNFPRLVKKPDGKVKRHTFFEAFLSCWNTLLASTTEQAYDDLLQEMKAKYPAPCYELLRRDLIALVKGEACCLLGESELSLRSDGY
jgi:hypothetical protein